MPTLPGGPELIILILVIVIIFGWKKLPDAARSLGRSMRIFKAEVEEMKEKPSAASRETVAGEARREPAYDDRPRTDAPRTDVPRTDAPRTDAPRDGDRYVADTGVRDEDQYRPPTA